MLGGLHDHPGAPAQRGRGEVVVDRLLAHKGGPSNDKHPGRRTDEPNDHSIGRSRGGLPTKTHVLVDRLGRPLTLSVTPGQAGDSPALPKLLAKLRVARRGPGRPRTRAQALRGDKAYSSRDHRALLGSGGIIAVIPERADQIGHRKNRSPRGGRPIIYDGADYKNRNAVERFFNRIKPGRALASRYNKKAVIYRGAVLTAILKLAVTTPETHPRSLGSHAAS